MCEHRCDSISKSIYNFEADIDFSNFIQNFVIGLINRLNKSYEAERYDKDKSFPDIVIKKKNETEEFAFLEIKVQSRTFMKIQELLSASNLYPSETLALNLSDLERYFLIKDEIKKPIFVVWALMNRPCITGLNFESVKFYHQEVDALKLIRVSDMNDTRRFRRKSGQGDVNESGEHKGVVVNYHFSINEMECGLPLLI